jgi:hypothetical protein
MIRRWLAPLCWCAAAMLRCNCAQAGVWGVDPVFGIAGDYATNPALLDQPHTAETNGALLLDAPTTYNGNAFEFFVMPSFRLSNTAGYSSLASDYEHLNVKGQLDSERSVLSATAGVAQDSSLYQDYLSDGTTGVRRDTVTGDLNWDRSLTERIDFNADANWTKVRYGEAIGIATLTDYKYLSISPTLSWVSSERDKLTLAANVARYNSLDGTTTSRSANLQIGFMRQLSEIWTLTAAAGYSRALNTLQGSEDVLVLTPSGLGIEIIPLRVESSQNGTVYSLNLTRKGTLLTLGAIASRQLTPTGFAYLSLQDSFELTASYTLSDRWSFTGDARYIKSQDPQLQGGILERTPKIFTVGATWRWTEHWTASLTASHVMEEFQPPGLDLASSEVMITLSRHFNHIKFQ